MPGYSDERKAAVLRKMLPPERCLKNRPPEGAAPIEVHYTRRDGDRCVSLARGVLKGELDGQIVIVSDGSERVLGLSGTAAEMWRLLLDRASNDEVIAELSRRYDAPSTTLAQDLDAFLEQLLSTGILLQERE